MSYQFELFGAGAGVLLGTIRGVRQVQRASQGLAHDVFTKTGKAPVTTLQKSLVVVKNAGVGGF